MVIELSVEVKGGVAGMKISAANAVADTQVNAVEDTDVNAVAVAALSVCRIHSLKNLAAVRESVHIELVAVVRSMVSAKLEVESAKNCVEIAARLSPTLKIQTPRILSVAMANVSSLTEMMAFVQTLQQWEAKT